MNKAWSSVLVALLKYVLGPLVAALLGMGYSDRNHEKSVKGYEVLATALNGQVVSRLDSLDRKLETIEARVDRIESAPATQPLRIDRIIVPGGRTDLFGISKAMRTAPKPATLSSKVLTKAPAVAPPAPTPAVHKSAPRQQLVPPKL